MATSGGSTGRDGSAEPGTALPPVLELLWGRRRRGRRAAGLSIDAIVDAAIAIADQEGLAGVSMAKVASALGFTTMSLYRHVAGKDELLALMWNASAAGIPTITGNGWRERLENWALAQMSGLQRRTWILELPMATPPAGPNSLAWVEQAMDALADSPLGAGERLGVVGLLSTFVLGEARMAHDSAIFREANGADIDYARVLRTVADEERFPQLYRAAWSGELDRPDTGEAGGDSPDWADDPGFMFGLERILDGVELLIQRRAAAGRAAQNDQSSAG
jgi:AcrR family transcriptional regulator